MTVIIIFSLNNNGIKIISKIAATRISDYAINKGFIRPEQFDFRNKEKCISLFVSIGEICHRRQFKKQPTYLAFLDLKKAYGFVPITISLLKSNVLVLEANAISLLNICI